MPLSDDGTTDFENTSANVDVLEEPDPKLDEKLLYMIGRISVIRQLLDEEAPLSPTTIKRIHRLKSLVAELPVPKVEKKRVGFTSP